MEKGSEVGWPPAKEKRKSNEVWIDNYMCSPQIEIPRCLALDVTNSQSY